LSEMGELKRSYSSNLLSAASARKVEEPVVYRVTPTPAPYIFPLKRAFSTGEIYSGASKVASSYCPFYQPIFHGYHRDWDLGNDYRHTKPRYDLDEKTHFSIKWPPYSRHHSDYPTSSYPSEFRHHRGYDPPKQYTRNVDYFDSFYWRCRLDPYSVGAFPGRQYAPWSFRPKVYDTMDTGQAARLYRQGLIGYDTFEKYFMKPKGWYNHYLGNL